MPLLGDMSLQHVVETILHQQLCVVVVVVVVVTNDAVAR